MNLWIAFSDTVFLLFIVALVVGAREARQVRITRLENQKLAGENLRLRKQLAQLVTCKGAEPLLKDFSGCIASQFGAPPSQAEPCAVTVGENLIKFRTGSDEPLDPGAAHTVLNCLYETTKRFYLKDREGFDSIGTIHLDGFTDCEGNVTENMGLGARRSLRLYNGLLARLGRDTTLLGRDRQTFLSRFAVRTYGQNRPVPGSRCEELGRFADDRRLTISVDMRLQRKTIAAEGR